MRFGPIGGSGIDSASSDSCGRRSSAVGAGICSLCCTSAYVLNCDPWVDLELVCYILLVTLMGRGSSSSGSCRP